MWVQYLFFVFFWLSVNDVFVHGFARFLPLHVHCVDLDVNSLVTHFRGGQAVPCCVHERKRV